MVGGFTLSWKSPYLRLIAAVILLLNVVNTTGEFLLTDIVAANAEAAVAAGESPNIGAYFTHFYGDFFFYVNIVGLLLQAFVVSRIVKYIGLRGIVFALPIVALGTYGFFAAGLGLVFLRWAKTAENSTDYSIMNTGKAMVWLPTNRDAKYKAKQAIDTLVVRVGDMFAAVLFLVGTLALGLGVQGIALFNLVLVVGWLAATYFMIRRYHAIEEDPSVDPVATGVEAGTSSPSP